MDSIRSRRFTARKLIPPLVAAYLLYNLLSFATLLLEVPIVRLLEKAICNRYYRAHPAAGQSLPTEVGEDQCKIAPVQDALGTIIGWQFSFNAMAGLLTAVYYGRAAEERGRKPVLFLSAVGITLMLLLVVVICAFDVAFDVHLAWLSGLFLLIGGGPRIFNSMVFATVSDNVPDMRRTKYLFFLHSGPHVNRLVTPLLAAVLMKVSIYWPFIVSLILLAATIAVVVLFDEQANTVKENGWDVDYEVVPYEEHTESSTDDESGEPHLQPNSKSRESTLTSETTTRLLPKLSRDVPSTLSLSWWHDSLAQIFQVFSTPTARICLAGFFVKRIAFTSEGFIFQYASEKFGWKLADTTWFRVSAAIGAILTTMCICPALTNVARSRNCSTHILDIWIVRTCLVVLFLSFFTAFKATSALWLFFAMFGMGLGEGIEPALQGIVTTFNDPAHYSQLFTTLAIVDTISELIGGPLTAALMSIGRTKNSASAGYCFMGSSLMFIALSLLFAFVTGKKPGGLMPLRRLLA